MTVDPSDSSYMPSVVVISAGDSIQSLKEVKTVHISATDSLCTLLEDAQEVWLTFHVIFHVTIHRERLSRLVPFPKTPSLKVLRY